MADFRASTPYSFIYTTSEFLSNSSAGYLYCASVDKCSLLLSRNVDYAPSNPADCLTRGEREGEGGCRLVEGNFEPLIAKVTWPSGISNVMAPYLGRSGHPTPSGLCHQRHA